MITTTKYSLKKPQDGDSADLKVFVGENMDAIETALDGKIDKSKIGTGLTLDADGTLSATGGGGSVSTTDGAFGNYKIQFNATTNTLDFVYIG